MEMGKLTAKLRDAVPVCFLVEGKEIKRYMNIEIPDVRKPQHTPRRRDAGSLAQSRGCADFQRTRYPYPGYPFLFAFSMQDCLDENPSEEAPTILPFGAIRLQRHCPALS